MYISKGTYKTAYDAIVKSVRDTSGGLNVVILCSLSPDSLFACRILASLLNSDYVPYRIIPISGWRGLQNVSETVIQNNKNLRSLVMLDLGALLDIADFFQLPPQLNVHIIDSHRPHNLANIFSLFYQGEKDQVIVWDDGDIEELDSEKKAWQALQLEPEPDYDSGTDSDDSESSAVVRGPKRRALGSESESDEEADEEDDNDNEGGSRKRARKEPNKLSKRERKAYKSKIEKYYDGGTYIGMSVAGQMYILATELNRTNNDLLWLSILGLTYQFVSNLIDRDRYDTYANAFSDEVARLNVVTDCDVKVTSANDHGIRISEELRFTLFRHWNLYDSMFHSGYVAGKLKLWRERGRKNLQGLLAKMGFSLAQCQQTYAHMDTDLKRSLRRKVDDFAPEYGLYDVAYLSFLRADGYQTMLSASDYVEGISSLLEVAHGVQGLDLGENEGSILKELEAVGLRRWNTHDSSKNHHDGEHADDDADEDDPEQEGELHEKKQTEWWVKNFWSAWDALGYSTRMVRASLPLSQALHKAVIRQGTSMLDKQAIKTLRTFRLAIIKEGPDLNLFLHPVTLNRLAYWLVDAVREVLEGMINSNGGVGSKPRSLPFVVASLDERRRTYLVVGVTGAADYGDVKKNRFGLAFQKAAYGTVINTRHERFDASIVELKQEDLMPFVEKLHTSL